MTYHVYVYWFDAGAGDRTKYQSFSEAWQRASWLLSPAMGYGYGNNEVVIRSYRQQSVTTSPLITPSP